MGLRRGAEFAGADIQPVAVEFIGVEQRQESLALPVAEIGATVSMSHCFLVARA